MELQCVLNKGKRQTMRIFIGNLFIEATVVAIVCLVFLALFIVSGIRQIIKNKNEEE